MSKKTLPIILSFALLIGLFTFTYIYFSKYSPKVLKKITEVKGLSSIYTDDVPYPRDAVKIGTNQTPTSRQTTFRTETPYQDIAVFYKNSYTEKRWRSVSEKITDSTIIMSYQKEGEVVTIVITEEGDNSTIVSIEKTKD
ncbi:hypothetical protein K0B04_00695 [Patescibacteria group bacterium]|nr:hypothetical protein [Patescibacteria group bacterium]